MSNRRVAVDDERLRRQIAFVLEIDQLKDVLRRSYRLSESGRENSAEHSWHLVMMAIVLGEHADEPIDLLHTLKMLAVHDLVEIDAGDTFVYDHADDAAVQAAKNEKEQRAADRVFGLLPDDQTDSIHDLWREYETRATAEARFAHTLDRLMPLLHNVHTAGRSWREHGVVASQVRALHATSGEGSRILGDYTQALIEEAVSKGFLSDEEP